MTLYDWKAFYRWLEEASAAELMDRRDTLVCLLGNLTEKAPRATIRSVIRKIEEELLGRAVLKK